MKDKILQAKCRYCKKIVASMYQGQLDYNVKAHEISCRFNPSNKANIKRLKCDKCGRLMEWNKPHFCKLHDNWWIRSNKTRERVKAK